MKDGKIAEMGTHQKLLKEGGEYAKLYNIQASAFIPVSRVLSRFVRSALTCVLRIENEYHCYNCGGYN
jgi:hypothetical protein